MGRDILRVQADATPGVVVVTVDNPPDQLVDAVFFGALVRLLDRLDADRDVRAVVWESADPDFFLMHGDVAALARVPAGGRPEAGRPNIAATTLDRLRRARYATVGALDGAARGGGAEFLTALDLRYGTARSVIGWPEVAMGILPGSGATARLPGVLGRARTLDILLTARDVRAPEAYALGWLQDVVEPGELAERVRAVARRIAAMPPASVAAVKQVVEVAERDPDGALAAESLALDSLMGAGAHLAPMAAFLSAGGQTRAAEADPERWAAVMDAVVRAGATATPHPASATAPDPGGDGAAPADA
ncbi:enoyl-CoA hydratase/isomerase family protein [Yinghuangia sp. YIM S09857]|uniref:enoyl-CoA hydratase/isomerase family protein n=1 Tax=Yinghuangia sp. YIM S09857 TaxID=3436929 RepID=UPI003F53AB1D